LGNRNTENQPAASQDQRNPDMVSGAIRLFEEFGVNHFIRGDDRLVNTTPKCEELCLALLKEDINEVESLRFEDWSIAFLIDYIIYNQHIYVARKLPEIDPLIDHLVEAHASTHPQLPMIRERFCDFKTDQLEHMADEEKMVFPSMKALEVKIRAVDHVDLHEFTNSINRMEEDHRLTHTSLKGLRSFCDNYQAPPQSSPGFKLLYEELKKFELDMHFHIHLENNILFKKVESALKSAMEKVG
jgi:regulator of cell morphogenesis and NO signaling